jgi:pilus assembly protein Flp/PilA
MTKKKNRSESGATAIEYGLIAALMVLVMIPALQALGGNTNGMWTLVANRVDAAMSGGR